MALLLSSAPANAFCIYAPDASHSNLHLDGFTPPAPLPVPQRIYYYVGNVNFFGVSTVGACVEAPGRSPTFYFILDQANHLLGWLPQTYNSMCLSNLDDSFLVLTQSETHCGMTMMPLNYNGHELDVAALNGNDHLDGGNGTDVFYGGNGSDNLADYSSTPGNNPIYQGVLYGESQGDLLWGSSANNTYLYGGNEGDGIADAGGTGDFLIGGYGDECCIYDGNGPGNIWCEAGTDTVRSLSGTHNCELTSSNCNSGLWACF
jgi:hypothetical protein